MYKAMARTHKFGDFFFRFSRFMISMILRSSARAVPSAIGCAPATCLISPLAFRTPIGARDCGMCTVSRGFMTGLSELMTRSLAIPLPYSAQVRSVSNKQRQKWKVRKYHFKLRLKRTMRKMRVPYVSSKARGQVKKKPILYDFRPLLRRKLKRAER